MNINNSAPTGLSALAARCLEGAAAALENQLAAVDDAAAAEQAAVEAANAAEAPEAAYKAPLAALRATAPTTAAGHKIFRGEVAQTLKDTWPNHAKHKEDLARNLARKKARTSPANAETVRQLRLELHKANTEKLVAQKELHEEQGKNLKMRAYIVGDEQQLKLLVNGERPPRPRAAVFKATRQHPNPLKRNRDALCESQEALPAAMEKVRVAGRLAGLDLGLDDVAQHNLALAHTELTMLKEYIQKLEVAVS